MNYSDYELVYMIKENEEAFSYMVKKYEPLFRKMAYYFCTKFPNRGLEVDDLIQQCRIVLCSCLERFDSDNDIRFYSYLLLCIKRNLYNHIDSALRKPSISHYMDCEFYDTIISFKSDDDLEKSYIDLEYNDMIKQFCYGLSIEESSIFELKYNGFTYKEISILLDISIKKVDNCLLKIRKNLEKYLMSHN